jgi:ferrous iron transport protein B
MAAKHHSEVHSPPRIAIIGNPNVGKSTLFNYLTGLNQKIGNYPGVTVDKKTGTLQIEGEQFEILDLPGT